MAWLSRVNFVSSDTLSFTDINNLGNDIRAWGDNVNGGGYTLSNVVLSASSGTMATVTGGTGAASTLTIRSTSGTGTSDAIVFQTASQSERMRITTGGNVGIGTSGPATRLHVLTENPTAANEMARFQGGTNLSNFRNYVSFYTTNPNFWWELSNEDSAGAGSSNGFAFRERSAVDPSVVRLYLASGGNVGIGTTTPSYQLQLSTDSAAKPATSTWTIASDERLKTVLGDYEKGLDAICALRPVRYEYNGLGGMVADGKEHISIVAQEAREVFPECIGTFVGKLHEDDEEETELLNYNGHAVTFALINAIKELKARLDALA